MRVENGMVVLERKDCNCARDSRLRPGYVIDKFNAKMCPKCKGTGKRGSGRCRECNAREGYWSDTFPRRPGYVADYSSFTVKVCPNCNGQPTNADKENMTDTLPAEVVAAIPITVLRSNRHQSWYEQHLGAGVYTIVDYGRHKNLSDEQLIAQVRESIVGSDFTTRQACKYAERDTKRLCDEIVIVTSDQGFSALPRWED